MEIISITTFTQMVPFFNRRQARKLIRWGVLESVIYGNRTFITLASVDAALAQMSKAFKAFSEEDLNRFVD